MKILSISITTALLLSSFTAVSADEGIDAQISAIQNADGEERRVLMNAFKRELAKMNEQERSETIAQMREQLQQMDQQQTKEHSRTMAEEGQADQMNNMHQYQHENQINNQINNMIQSTTQQPGRTNKP